MTSAWTNETAIQRWNDTATPDALEGYVKLPNFLIVAADRSQAAQSRS